MTTTLIIELERLNKEVASTPWEIWPGGEIYSEGSGKYIGEADPSDAELIVTLRNNLNTILQWGRVVEAAKEYMDFIPYSDKTLFEESELGQKLRDMLSSLEFSL